MERHELWMDGWILPPLSPVSRVLFVEGRGKGREGKGLSHLVMVIREVVRTSPELLLWETPRRLAVLDCDCDTVLDMLYCTLLSEDEACVWLLPWVLTYLPSVGR